MATPKTLPNIKKHNPKNIEAIVVILIDSFPVAMGLNFLLAKSFCLSKRSLTRKQKLLPEKKYRNRYAAESKSEYWGLYAVTANTPAMNPAEGLIE